MEGDLVLEVPIQNSPVPINILRRAADLGITIRDEEGTVHKLPKNERRGQSTPTSNEKTTHVEYTWKWNYLENRVGVPLSEPEARLRHDNGEDYIALLGRSPNTCHPILVTLSINHEYASTEFLDKHGRPYIKYHFRQKNKEMMFLETVHIWHYPDEDPDLSRKDSNANEKYTYRENGYAKHVSINEDENVKETIEYTDVPVEMNWEPVPEFGDFKSIARWERR